MKVYVDELPRSCNDCKFQVFVAHYEYGWQHHERYCSIMKENYNCKCSKENCPLKSLAEHDKQVRKEVCDEIIKFVDSNSKYTQEYGDIIYSMSLIRELDKLIEIDEPNQTQGE